MKPQLLLIIVVVLKTSIYAQQHSFTKSPSLGVHITAFDLAGADTLARFGRNAKPGFAISFQNNSTKKIDYSLKIAGSFLDFTDRNNKSLGNGKKQLLLETDAVLRAKLFPTKVLFNPYAQAGAGVSLYNNYVGVYVPAGIGCQVNLTPDLFILVNSQYRLPVTNTQHRHFFHSVGLAGTIYRKKINKANVPVVPIIVVNKPVDTDGDGIVDSVDNCPTLIGVVRNHGCPEVKTSITEKINLAATQIFFATGRYELLPASFVALNEVADILKQHPALQLSIEGHTDNQGTPQANQLLSQNRAQSVKQYLEKAGIASSRLQAVGYGQQRPVADNDTEEGRSKNRRVELHVVPKQE